MYEKQKKLFNYVRLVKKHAFLLAKLFETHENQSKEEELVKKNFFFATRWPSPKG